MLQTLWQDVRYGIRMLARSPGLTAVTVLTLALGMGANTAIFSLVDVILLRQLPVVRPDQLVLLNWATQKWPGGLLTNLVGSVWTDASGRPTSGSFSYPTFQHIRARDQVCSAIFAFADPGRLSVSLDGQAELATGELVSGEYFSGLGVRAVVGRTITQEDDRPERANPVAVLSYGYWERRFGRDPSAVGKGLRLNNVPFTIIGVTAPEFFGVRPGVSPEIWVPISLQAQLLPRWISAGHPYLDAADTWWVQIMGRLKPGVSALQARAALDVLFKASLTSGSRSPDGPRQTPQIELTPGSRGLDNLRREFSRPLFLLMGVAGVVLVIACTNVANLLLARATARLNEIAVRLALGAGRLPLVRQLLSESIVLAVTGGAVGLLFAIWGRDLFSSLLRGQEAFRGVDFCLNSRVLAFTGGISVATGMLFGLAPALRSTRVPLTPALQGTRNLSHGKNNLVRTLVVVQVALSLLLLIGAGLFISTLQNLRYLNPGFDPQRLLLFSIDPALTGYREDQLAGVYNQLLERINSLPAVRSASLCSSSLLSGTSWTTQVSAQGASTLPGDTPDTPGLIVGPNFFETMKVPLVRGRGFDQEDNERTPGVVVVNETLARTLFRGADPIGRHIDCGSRKSLEVVGVAKDARYTGLRAEGQPIFFLSCFQNSLGSMTFVVRTAGNPADMIAAIRHELRAIDPNVAMSDIRTQAEQLDDSLLQERLFALVTGAFGGLALLLAASGLYAVLSYVVVQRTHEIGIRMALGAEPGDVVKLIVGQGLKLALAGVTIGLAAAFALTRLLASFLFGVTPTDPVTLVGVVLLLAVVALLACYVPALRATRVDPIVALRYE